MFPRLILASSTVLVAFSLLAPRRMPHAGVSQDLATSATCPQLPGGGLSLTPRNDDDAFMADYAVSVTPDSSPVTWTANTNGHTSTFTVTNTGLCQDTYSFTKSSTGPISGISLNKSSAPLGPGANTTVVATYNVGQGAPGVLILTAAGGVGGESDNGTFKVKLVGVAVTPDAQALTVKSLSSQAVRFQVTNIGSDTNTFTLTCSASGNETCLAVLGSPLKLAPGAGDSATVDFGAGAVGTGTVTLSASGSGGGSDNGSYSVTNTASPATGVAVTPDAQALSVTANSGQTASFQLQNTGTTANTYSVTCSATGNEACGTVSPSVISVWPGDARGVNVSFTAGAVGSGTLTLSAVGTGGGVTDNGSFSVTNIAPTYNPPVTRGVTVTPDNLGLTENTTTGPVSFVVQNTGNASDNFALSCAGGGNNTCLSITPSSLSLAAGASAPVAASFSGGTPGTGSVTLYATGTGVGDYGRYNVTNVSVAAGSTYSISVSPKGGSPQSWLANTSGHVSLFTVLNTGDGIEDYGFTCIPSGAVTSCSLNITGVLTFRGSSTATVAATYAVGAAGTGVLKVAAIGADHLTATDTGFINVTAVAPTYTVAVTPDGQATSASANSGANPSLAFTVQNGGTGTDTYTLTCTVAGNETCGAVTPSSLSSVAPGAVAPVTVAFTAGAVGTGTVWLKAVGSTGAKDSGSYNITNTYFVAVTPDGVAKARLPSRTYSDSFTVQNPGTSSTTYTLTATCSGTAIASGCAPSPASFTLGGGAVATGAVSYTTSASAGSTGVVKLIATASGAPTVKDSGWSNVTIGTAQAPVIDVSTVNSGTTRERGLCLTMAAGAAAAAECGDLRIVHPLPVTRTLNKVQAPTLIYNSSEARPYPLVAANVTLPATAATPDTVSATLTITTLRGTAKWQGTDWAPGAVRRIVIADTTGTLTTGIYTYTLAVTNIWNGASSLTQSVTGNIAVVDRRQSALGAGWWLAGLERLYTGPMLWVGGDGSTRQYTAAGTNKWGAPSLDRPDTLVFDPATGRYSRILPHGLRVQFDGQGRHIATINRLSDTTTFTYAGSSDTLLTINLARTTLTYQFTYTGGTKWIATAPSLAGQTRADTGIIAGGRLTALGGPDNTRIVFAYVAGGDSNLVVSRTDRRGYITSYAYDQGKKLSRSSLDMGIGQTPIASGWRPIETLGYPPIGAVPALDTALAYARYDGPRIDVFDTMSVWFDHLGAPRRVVNPAGYATSIKRENATYPALATEVDGPTGLVTRAHYDARGNVDSLIKLNPLGDGQNAVTTSTWDGTWDFVTSITLPMGEVTQFGYDAANGNRLYMQPGTSSTRRITFAYADTFHLLSSVQYPTTPVSRDSFAYDPTLGNLQMSLAPLRDSTVWTRDAIGRETLVQTALVLGAAKSLFQRHSYDVGDRDTLSVSRSDSASSDGQKDSLVVRNHYDRAGNLDTVQTKSYPDRASIDWIKHTYTFDRANRQITEFLVGPFTAVIPFRYDPAGNLTNGGRQGGDAVSVYYDVLGRPIQRNASDTATFTYDTLGNALTANNFAARISRTYYRNGALRADTLRLALDYLPAQDFTQHVYGQRFGYDLEGRPIWAKHPAQLAPGPDSVVYAYDAVFGQLGSIRDALGNTYTVTYDVLGRPIRTARLAQSIDSVYETLSYDADGQVAKSIVQTGGAILRQDSLLYDARGKVTRGGSDTLTYAPLGPIVRSMLSPSFNLETYVLDALENRTQSTFGPSSNSQFYHYEPGTGHLLYRDEFVLGSTIRDTMYYTVDDKGRTGNTHHVHMWTPVCCVYNTEHRYVDHWYDAQNRLTKTRYTLDTTFRAGPPPSGYQAYASDETYRYDALGRRVYARAVRGPNCVHKDKASGCLSTLTRTVWSGDQLLYEIRVPGDTGSPDLENDAIGPQAHFGVVGYLHAGSIDQPLALWKGASDLVLPIANWRGAFMQGTCPTADCGSAVWFPAATETSFGEKGPYPNGPPSWHGSLLESGADASGYQYKRNRYYDPSTGRFTQEDPVGLAGGFNLYGFAGGDPVTFSDPFGLVGCKYHDIACWNDLVWAKIGGKGYTGAVGAQFVSNMFFLFGASSVDENSREAARGSKVALALVIGEIALNALPAAEGLLQGTKTTVRAGLEGLDAAPEVISGIRRALGHGQIDGALVETFSEGGARVTTYVRGGDQVTSTMYTYLIARNGRTLQVFKTVRNAVGKVTEAIIK